MTKKPASHLFGETAESLAAQHLKKKGYRILGRNVRLYGGELDVIARDGKTLVFVEVKARRSDSHGGILSTIAESKKQRLIKLAACYLSQHQLSHQDCRFDVVLCRQHPDDSFEIIHIEQAFDVPGEDSRW
ncbi:MAG: hypothetical protein NPIRA05_22490 [Nitrospirales bacterium]|nr:MAG: hypothetical protein NPIRA05_22490 [Nitrospirales bacterium]